MLQLQWIKAQSLKKIGRVKGLLEITLAGLRVNNSESFFFIVQQWCMYIKWCLCNKLIMTPNTWLNRICTQLAIKFSEPRCYKTVNYLTGILSL